MFFYNISNVYFKKKEPSTKILFSTYHPNLRCFFIKKTTWTGSQVLVTLLHFYLKKKMFIVYLYKTI